MYGKWPEMLRNHTKKLHTTKANVRKLKKTLISSAASKYSQIDILKNALCGLYHFASQPFNYNYVCQRASHVTKFIVKMTILFL